MRLRFWVEIVLKEPGTPPPPFTSHWVPTYRRLANILCTLSQIAFYLYIPYWLGPRRSGLAEAVRAWLPGPIHWHACSHRTRTRTRTTRTRTHIEQRRGEDPGQTQYRDPLRLPVASTKWWCYATVTQYSTVTYF